MSNPPNWGQEPQHGQGWAPDPNAANAPGAAPSSFGRPPTPAERQQAEELRGQGAHHQPTEAIAGYNPTMQLPLQPPQHSPQPPLQQQQSPTSSTNPYLPSTTPQYAGGVPPSPYAQPPRVPGAPVPTGLPGAGQPGAGQPGQQAPQGPGLQGPGAQGQSWQGQAPGGMPPHLNQAGQQSPAKRSSKTPLFIVLGAAALVILLVAGAVIGEFVTRGNVSGRLQAVATAMSVTHGPDGAVQGGYDYSVDAALYLPQVLSGSYDRVTFTGVSQTLGGQAFESTIDLYGLSSSLSGPAERIEVQTNAAPGSLDEWLVELAGQSDENYEMTVELLDGQARISYSFTYVDATFDYYVEIRTDGSGFVAQVINSTMTIGGTPLSLGEEPPVDLNMCEDVSGIETTADSVTISPEGISFAWTVTGEGATLDNLGAIASCV